MTTQTKTFAFTAEQQNTLRDYMTARNAENWGMWPATDKWPIPAEAGACSATQMQNKSGTATIVKFDRAVTLSDGRKAKRIGVGHTRNLGFEIAFLF